MIMENSSASAFSDDEIQNNMNMGSCIIDFPFAPALPSCSVFDLPPPPSPLSDPHNLNDASFAGYMDDFNFNTSNWFPCYNFETGTGTSESLPAGAATQTDLQLPPLPVLSPAMPSEALNSQATAVSGSSSNTLSSNEAGAVGNKLVAVAGNEDGVQSVEGKQAEDDEVRDRNEDHRIEVVENRNDQNQTKKPVKPKRKYKPRQRPAKVTFKMETEVDHLDDGFRWRKYGQKPIKNSPFPRSYYRCTTAGCGVKKHIERYAPEPSMLLTSYEGSHNHLAPKVTRTARLEIMHDDAIAAGVQKIQHNQIKTNGVGVAGNQFAMSQSQPQQFQNQNLNVILQKPALPSLSYNNDYNNSFNIASAMNVNSADNFPPLNVVNSPAAHNSPPMNVVNSSAARNSPHMNVVNFSAARNSPPMNVVNFSAARNSPPMNVVNFSAAHNSSPSLNIVNSSAAHNSPTFNVVKNADIFINSSTTFSEFLQNLGGCNFSTLTNYNLMSNDGLLQDMIMPREMRGASSEAGAGAGAGAVS